MEKFVKLTPNYRLGYIYYLSDQGQGHLFERSLNINTETCQIQARIPRMINRNGDTDKKLIVIPTPIQNSKGKDERKRRKNRNIPMMKTVVRTQKLIKR